MDRSPFDVESLAKIANDLFREAGPVVPTPLDIPSAAQAAAPSPDQGLDASARHGVGVPAGGATFSPNALPNRPAFGRPMPAEAPDVGYGTGQPAVGTVPGPYVGAPTLGFDPLSLPGFSTIPHIEDGFEIPNLGQGFDPSAASGFGAPSPNASGLPPTSATGRVPGLDAVRRTPVSQSADGATFSPVAPPNRPVAGRPAATDFDVIGYGGGQPRFGTTPGPDSPLGLDPRGFDPQALNLTSIHLQSLAGLPSIQDAAEGFELSGLETSVQSAFHPFENPTTVPTAGGHPGAVVTQPTGGRPSFERPTPNGFEFKDAPHLGEFPEQQHLRAALAPQPPSQPGPPGGAPVQGAGPPSATPPGTFGGLPVSGLESIGLSQSPSFYFLADGMDYFANDVPKLPLSTGTPFNAEAVQADFPILRQKVNGYPLVWLDNGATTQKPQVVIDRLKHFYETDNSNINRSAHELAARASDAYDDARKTVQRFINAPSTEELVFVRGTTEGINLVAQSFGRRFIKAGDEIVLTHAEHHANIVPWYLIAKEVGATLKIVPFDDKGEILLDEYERLLNDRTKIVAMSHVSNALGTVLPAKAMAEMAHRNGIPVLLDGAQSISHMPIDMQELDCDFFVFSGHKVFAPTGIGVVYGKKALLDQMPPWQGGGNMIKDVTFEKITFQPAPGRFEAGTGNIADAIGLAEAFKYLERLGMANIAQHEHAVLDYATQKLAPIKGLTIIGQAQEKAGVISFLLEGKEPAEVGKALNQKGIAVRAGHHCALPILRRYGVEATVRPAFAIYNTFADADRLVEAVREIAAN